jgi:hypothetical protein
MLPDNLLVFNTLVVQVVVAIAFYRFVVRRAEHPRRARVTFLLGLVLLAVCESLVGAEVLLEPTPKMRVYAHGEPSTGLVVFQCDWVESRLLGRPSNQLVSVTARSSRTQAAPAVAAKLWPRVIADRSTDVENAAEKREIGRALWNALYGRVDPAVAGISSR